MCLTASRSKPGSGLCGTQAREAPQPRGKVSKPSSALRSRSDTHSGLLQAFFFCPREPAPPTGNLARWLLLPPFTHSVLPSPTAPRVTGLPPCRQATLARIHGEGSGRGPHSPPTSSQPCFAAAQFFLLMAAELSPSGQVPRQQGFGSPKPSQPLGPRQGTDNQHRKDLLGVRPWPLPLRQLRPPAPPRGSGSQRPPCSHAHRESGRCRLTDRVLPSPARLEHGQAAQPARA